jgi:hypothetical protein
MDGCDIRALGRGNRDVFSAEDAKDADEFHALVIPSAARDLQLFFG